MPKAENLWTFRTRICILSKRLAAPPRLNYTVSWSHLPGTEAAELVIVRDTGILDDFMKEIALEIESQGGS